MARTGLQVWFVVVPGGELLDVSGPWGVLGYANDVIGREVYALRLKTPPPVAEIEGRVAMRHGLALAAAERLPRRPTRLPDLLVVAGGDPRSPPPAAERWISGWLRRHHTRIPTIVSICTGAFILGEAGLLDGRRCTTHWRYVDDLRRRFPRARVEEEGIFVCDGDLWTSAGITTGMDATLALVETHHGHDVAMAVARQLVLFLRRSPTR